MKIIYMSFTVIYFKDDSSIMGMTTWIITLSKKWRK